jgi:hypothetical protein
MWAACTGAALGCSGTIGAIDPSGSTSGDDPAARGVNGPSTPGADPSGVGGPTDIKYPPARVRLLNAVEYDNTVAAVLGDTTHLGADFEPGNRQNGYLSNAAQFVDAVLAGQLFQAADTLATNAVQSQWSKLVPCDPKMTSEDVCAKQFIAAFATSAFRRPATTDEEAALFAVYQKGRAVTDFKSGVQATIAAVLMSEPFLYRTEIGEEGTVPSADHAIRLAPYEMASALSYLILGSPPDAPLLQAAAGNALATVDQVGAQAKRLLGDPRAVPQLKSFMTDWLQLSALDKLGKNATAYPKFTPTLKTAIENETSAFLADWLAGQGNATAKSLLTARYSFADKELGALYGANVATVGTLARVDLPPERIGILMQAGWLATFAHDDGSAPVKRGVFVRRQVLCEDLPPPPAGLKVTLPEPAPNATTRQIFDSHGSQGACASCHTLIQSVGDAFEDFDGMGAYRTTENGQPVDTSVKVVGTDSSNGVYPDAPAMISKLADSQEVADCFKRQFARFAAAERDDDREAGFVAATGNLGAGSIYDLLLAYVTSDVFAKRSEP